MSEQNDIPRPIHPLKYHTQSSKRLPIYWVGTPPAQCNLCENPITTQFVDGKVAGMSSWAIMCPTCFRDFGLGLGLGRGQLFEQQPDKLFLKIEG